MQFTLKKMQHADAHQIASWHYPAPYDFYDADQDQEDVAELLDPQSWQESYYSVFNLSRVEPFSRRRESEPKVTRISGKFPLTYFPNLHIVIAS